MNSPPQTGKASAGGSEGAEPPNLKALAWTGSTYFAQGLPWSILHQVAAEFFTTIGVAPSGVGRTSLLHGPMLFKVFWSPIVAMVSTLRTWMVATQAFMGILLGGLALAAHSLVQKLDIGAELNDAGSPDMSTVWAILLSIGVLSAVHDIACDGFYMTALRDKDQARYSGYRVAAFRSAMLVGGSGLVIIAGRTSWLAAFAAASALMIALALIHHFILPRPQASPVSDEVESKKRKKSFRDFAAPYLSFLRQDSVLLVLAFLVLYKMADALMFSMSSVFLARELGIDADLRGLIRAFSTIAGIFGAVWGGSEIARRGLKKTLWLFTLLMVVTEPLYALLAAFAPQLSLFQNGVATNMESVDWGAHGLTLVVVTGVIVIEQIFGGLATAAQVVFIMRRCNPQHKTTHYAFATVVISLSQMGLGVASGEVYELFGPEVYFWLVSLAAIPAIILAKYVPLGEEKAPASGSC